ncbi:MAG TPA: DUF4384 domain-containing protein [Gemmatimonadales bacterium]|nr:DUF4384 domain-containing protein [Gemmatimonadales bacterium]
MVTTIGLVSLLVGAPGVPAAGTRVASRSFLDDGGRARVEVWTDRGEDPYASGQGVRVHFRTAEDGYVTILRLDTDGRVRMLYPREPWEDTFAEGGREYDVPGSGEGNAFYIDDYPGVGYVFAVLARDPFVYDAIVTRDHWDYRSIANGRVHGDPYVAVTDLAQRIVPDGYRDWDYDVAPYYVERHYDYPRFLCYDCHTYASYPYWNAYDYTCVRFRIVVVDDPYYYPYRYYGGTRVVFTRPLRPEPRFIFKDRQPTDAFVTRVRERRADDGGRRFVTGGGGGGGGGGGDGGNHQPSVRPRPRSPGEDGGDDRGGRRHAGDDHPDHPDHPYHPDRPGQPDRRPPADRPGSQARSADPERRRGSSYDSRAEDRRPPADRPDSRAWSADPDRRRGSSYDPRAADRRAPADRPERRDWPVVPQRSERPDRTELPERRSAPERRSEPPPRAEPRREAPEPRSEPRAEPRSEAPREQPRAEPELKRRKPV